MNINLDAIRNGVSLKDAIGKLPKVPVASAVSGLIVAALILMTPNPLFEAFIVETGLPNILAAAEPPLGARARVVFALIAALIVTGGAWVALTLYMKRQHTSREDREYRYVPSAGDDEHARLRRADAHPDAPYRRPIMAGSDLGMPLDHITADRNEMAAQPETDDILDLGEIAEIVDADPFMEAANELVSDAVDRPAPFEAEAASQPEETVEERPEPVFEIPLPRRDDEVRDTSEKPAPQMEEPAPRPSDHRAANVKGELADLVARLEAGLERKRSRSQAAPQERADGMAENVTTHPQARPESDHEAALREALDALQKVAGKAG